jgi:hypothetical protein
MLPHSDMVRSRKCLPFACTWVRHRFLVAPLFGFLCYVVLFCLCCLFSSSVLCVFPQHAAFDLSSILIYTRAKSK